MARLRAEQQELRTTIATLRQVTHDLTRELARRPAASPAAGAAASTDAPQRPRSADVIRGAEPQVRRLRGSVQRNPGGDPRAADGVSGVFAGQADVLDIGCGRGEFLALLQEHGVTARGIDVNESMVEVCQSKGLDATRADALAYLRQQPPGSLGGLMAAQVVEHLDPAYLAALLDAAFDALRPGAPIVLETINRRAGSRSSRATSATSRTCGRCIRTH